MSKTLNMSRSAMELDDEIPHDLESSCPEEPVSHHTSSVQAHIERLRREMKDLEDLQQLKEGPCFNNGPPMPNPARNFAIQEQPSNGPSRPVSSGRRGVIGKIVRLVLLGGTIAGIVSLVNFMKDNNIGFLQSDPGNTPFTLTEVALHNTPDDCWMVIHDKVFDLTAYAKRHPGGARIVTDLAGTDATAEYDRFHSISLLDSVRGDIIGLLVVDDGESGGNSIGRGNGITNTNSSGGGLTLSEVAKHNTPGDCWVAMHNAVYDMTTYANHHPGGARVITNHCGTDGTIAYARFHPQGLLGSLRDGELKGSLDGATSNGGGMNGGFIGDYSMDSDDD
jgi:cytochrome b involved in lipid metabolism